MRFLDRTGKEPSESILKVGVEYALKQVFWDEEAFYQRGGVYDWGKEGQTGGCEGGLDVPDW
jgi:radical S-adenosyl methionine domain-containing protein 2